VHGEWKLRRSQIASITNETISSISQKPENCDDEEIGLNFKDLVLLTTADKDYFTFGGVVKWKRDGGIIMFAVDSKEAVFIIGCDTRIVREWQQVDGTRRVERKSDYYIIAIDSKSGKDIWRRPLLLDGGCPVSMCIGGSGEWIFINHKGKVGSNNQGCCAINPLTGYTIWSVKIDGGKICDPCHLVYCASNNAIYFCMAIANGSNEVYETYVDIVILNASNGSITNRYSELVRHEQRVELHEQPKASRQALDDRPHIVLSKNNTIYLDSVYGVLMAFDLNRKKVIWKRTGDICLLAIGDNETLLLQDGNKYLFAINGFNGDVLWRINTKIEARHGISANKIFYTNSGAFHENDGTHLFEFNEEVYTNSAPCVGDNHTCYYISTDGLVVAIDGLTGKEIWKTCPLDIKIPNQLGHPCVIGASGTLYYYIASPHCLLSVASTSKGPANSPWPMVGQNCQHTCSPLSAKPT
jgi:outer membrane protein assembly factor BamB